MKTSNKSTAILKTAINVIVGFAIFLLATNFSSIAYRICDDFVIKARLLTFVLQLLSVLFCLYLYTKYIMKCSLGDLYIRKPGPKKIWYITAFIMPIAVSTFYLIFIPGKFCKETLSQNEVIGLLISSILLYGLMTGITEEMIFRGLIMRSIETSFGKRTAAVISSVLFAINHLEIIDMADPRNVVLLLISITIAGLALAFITYQTGSIWSAVVIHTIYNILSGGSSLFNISTEHSFPAIFTFTLKSSNWLIAGIPGANNIDTTLPAIIGFIVIICIALYLMKHEK